MACANHPGEDKERQMGRCHICKEWRSCGFCPLCCHWLCRTCNGAWASRALAALKAFVGGVQPNCCGPTCQPPRLD